MRQLRDSVVTLGSRLNPGLLVVLVVALNVYWFVILAIINREFQSVTNGRPLLDLQNSLAPGEIITPTKVLEQLGDYTQASRFIYWVFFVLDNIMPHLAFGSLALLWVYFWRSNPNRLYNWLLGGYAVLIPLGVGVFDWLENLFYLVAIHAYPAPGTVWAVVAGLTFKWLKAVCLPVYVAGASVSGLSPLLRPSAPNKEAAHRFVTRDARRGFKKTLLRRIFVYSSFWLSSSRW